MTTAFRHAALLVSTALVAALASGCGSNSGSPTSPTPPPTQTTFPIMAAFRLTPAQLVAWFNGRQPRPSGTYAATEPVESLAAYFIEEGAAEGVTGDIAFCQSVHETGWFRFSGTVPGWMNNFAGIGATDTNPRPATFPDARTGVRAQIQHLRAYADPTAVACTAPPLRFPCVDPRFDLVTPKGRAPTWNQMGNGNWATDPNYSMSILGLYREALAYHNLR